MVPDHKPIPDPPYPPLSPVAGSDDPDAMLSGSEFLTAEETIRRRHFRITQLSRIYRDHYWALMADLRSKYRDYLWYYGSSPFVGGEKSQVSEFGLWNGEVDLCRGKVDGLDVSRCAHSSCKQKAMPMTRFCHSHILDDSKQVLYKGCTRVATKSGSSARTVCGKPILRSVTPAFCSIHLQRAQKAVAKSLKEAGLTKLDSNRMAPAFHIISVEFVKVILNKRRASIEGRVNDDKMDEDVK